MNEIISLINSIFLGILVIGRFSTYFSNGYFVSFFVAMLHVKTLEITSPSSSVLIVE